MAEFTPIISQEQLDAVIGDRLKRNEEKWTRKYDGYMSPDDVNAKTADLNKQIENLTAALDSANKKAASYDSDIAERDARIKGFEISATRTRVAQELGLNLDAIGFISGEDEDSIRKSAESLKALLGTQHQSTPAFDNEPPAPNSSAAYMNMLKGLSNEK